MILLGSYSALVLYSDTFSSFSYLAVLSGHAKLSQPLVSKQLVCIDHFTTLPKQVSQVRAVEAFLYKTSCIVLHLVPYLHLQ